MRSRRLALPPSLRIDAQLEMLLKRYRYRRYLTSVYYTLLNRTPARWY